MSGPPVLAASNSRRGLRIASLCVMLLAGGFGIWWYNREPKPAIEPPNIPEGIQEREVREALEKSRAEVVAEPNSATTWGQFAMLLLAHLFDRESDRCFAEAAQLDSADPRWPYGRGQIALKREPNTAIELLQQAIATTGPGEEYRAAARLTLAEALLERGKIDRAAELFTQELGPLPGEPRARFGLGQIAIARGDAARAIELLTPLKTHPHARKQSLAHLSRLAAERGDETAAAAFARQATALPDDTVWPDPLLDEIARMAVGRRGRDRKIADFEQAGLHFQALELYLRQLEEERSVKSLLGAGVNYLRLKDYDNAHRLVSEAVKLEPNSPQTQYTMSLVYFVPAEREIDRDPSSEKARKWFQEALIHAKRAAELKPDHARAYLHWGLCLMHLGDAKAAIEPLKKGLVVRPEEFDLHFAMGQVLAKTGDRTGAEASFKNAQRIDPKNPAPARELEKLK